MIYEDLLANCFGIIPRDVYEVRGGWSAKAYRVDTARHSYFLKSYDKLQPSVQPWVKRIDAYISVLGWLSKTQDLRGLIAEPIPALNGDYKVESADHVFLLFTYVQGDTPGERGLSRSQVTELARILARLHCFGESIPCDTTGIREDISLSFCNNLERYLTDAHNQDDLLSRFVSPKADMIRFAITETVRLRDTARMNAQSLVLCHTDAHYNNVIQRNQLVLVDWEDIRLAPAEADLFMYALNPYWPAFWQAYSAIRSDFRIDMRLLRFYLIRRRLDDIWYYISRILLDEPKEDEVSRICGRLTSAFSETQRLLSDKLILDLGE